MHALDSPPGSRRGSATFPGITSSLRRNRFERPPVQPTRTAIPLSSQHLARTHSAPAPHTPRTDTLPPGLIYWSGAFSPRPNPHLARALSIASLLRYTNKQRFDQEDLSRLPTAAGTKATSRPGTTLGSRHEAARKNPTRVHHGKNAICVLRRGNCPCGLGQQRSVPGAFDMGNVDIPPLHVTNMDRAEHDRLCPRHFSSAGAPDFHWRDGRPMWLPELSDGFALPGMESLICQYPRDLWRDWEATRWWVYGRPPIPLDLRKMYKLCA